MAIQDPVVNPLNGIPQSTAPPEGMTAVFGENPWDVDNDLLEQEQRAWRAAAFAEVDSAVTNPDKFFGDQDLGFGADVKQGRTLATNDLFLKAVNDGENVPVRGPEREALRNRVAFQYFNGLGAKSEEDFNAQIVKRTTEVNGRRETYKELQTDAWKAAVLSEAEPDSPNEFTFDAFLERAKSKPGFQPDDVVDLRIAWNESTQELRQRIEPFREELSQVWGAMKQGGKGTLSEVLKEVVGGDLTNPTETIIRTGVELGREDAAATAYRIYSGLPDAEKPMFLDALGVVAQSFPKEQREGFFNNLVKQGGRGVDDFAANVGSIPGRGDGVFTAGDFIEGVGQTGAQLRRTIQSERDEILKRKDFVDEVRRIERGDFDPINYLSDEDSGFRIIEEGLYQAPGAFFTSAVFATPFVGQALALSSMEGASYSAIRDNLLKSGVSPERARVLAADMAPLAAVPQGVMEKFQANAIMGKLPFFDAALRRIGDQVSNLAVRGAVRTGIGAGQEALLEVSQDYVNFAVQDIASALSMDVPDVVWSDGENGVLDGFWTDYATNFVTMLPLAIFGAAGGVSQDQRVRAFQDASDTQLLALGVRPDDVAEFRASKGIDSGNAAIDKMFANLDPQSEIAKASTEAMLSEQEAAAEAVALAQDSGVFPTISQSADGWTVTDRTTGTQYGPVSSVDQAVKLAQENFSAVQNASANQMDYLTSMLESVEASRQMDREGSETETVLDLGLRMTPEIMQASSPQAAEDLRLQIDAMERAGELTPGLARIVYGMSQTDANRMQRQTVNKLFQGSSVATVFHEYFHGIRREALAQNRITPAEELEFLWEFDQEFKASNNKRGLSLGLFPDGITKDQVTEKMRDEAVSKIAEAEVLKSRRGGRSRDTETRDSVLPLPAGTVTRNIRSLVRKGLRSAKKFSDLFNAVRGYFGLAMGRAVILRQLERKGSPTAGRYQEYLSKLTGLTEQDMVDRKANEVAQEITGDSSFSVGDEILDPLISNSVDRIKDPKQQAAAFQRIVRELQRLRQTVSERGVAFGQEQFSGTEHEAALDELDKRRAAALETFENRLIETSRPQARLEYERELSKIDAAEQRLAERGSLSDQRQGIIDALATFDGILSALPPDLRGRIGGFTQLASLTTNEARLKFLEGRLEKADNVIGAYLKKEYGRLFDKLLERAKPKSKAGKKPTGKLGGDVHDLFRVIGEARTWDSDKADAEAMALEAQIGTGNLTPEQEAHVALEAQMIRMVVDWKNADASQRAAALEAATSIYEAGYAKFKLATLMRAEDRKIRIKAFEKDTGKAGTPAERDKKLLEDNSLKGGWKDSLLSLISFEQTAEYLFGRGSKEAVGMVDAERKASNQYEDRYQDKAEELQNFYTQRAGSNLAGEKLQYQMAQKNVTVGTGDNQRTLSQDDIVDALMMYRQEDGKRHFEGRKDENGNPSGKWHYGADWIAEAESKMTDDARALMAFLSEKYAAEWAYINPLFEEINGVNLPYNDLYSPISVVPREAKVGEMIDPVTGLVSSGLSSTPSWAKSRGTSISQPKFIGASQKYLAHTKQVEQWMAYAPFIRDYASPIRNDELGDAIEAKGGAAALKSIRLWMDHFQQGGNRDAGAQLALNQFMTRVAGRAASTALIGRMGVLAIQATQLGAAAAEMPLSAYLVRLGKLTTGQLDYTEALKSDFIQRRIRQLPPAVRAAMDGLKGTNPNAIKYAQRKMGELIGGVDGLVTAGTFAMVYDYQLSQAAELGFTGEEAKAWARNEAERSTERIAQPTRSGTRSLFENTGGGPALRIVYSFASEARQKLALSVWRIASKDRSLGEKARAAAVTWVVGGLIASMIRAAVRDLKEDDEEEKFDPWDAKRLFLSALTGPLQGIPFLGEEIESAIWKTSGEYMPSGTLLGAIPNAFTAATRVLDWGDSKPDEIMRDVDQILQGLGLFHDDVAAASSLMHLARDLYSLGENAVD